MTLCALSNFTWKYATQRRNTEKDDRWENWPSVSSFLLGRLETWYTRGMACKGIRESSMFFYFCWLVFKADDFFPTHSLLFLKYPLHAGACCAACCGNRHLHQTRSCLQGVDCLRNDMKVQRKWSPQELEKAFSLIWCWHGWRNGAGRKGVPDLPEGRAKTLGHWQWAQNTLGPLQGSVVSNLVTRAVLSNSHGPVFCFGSRSSDTMQSHVRSQSITLAPDRSCFHLCVRL